MVLPLSPEKTKESEKDTTSSISGLTSDMKEVRGLMMDRVRAKEIGNRDLSTLSAALVKLDNQLAASKEDTWWQRVQELKKASDAIEDLNIGKSEDYAEFFDNGKKNPIFLAD